MKLTFRFDGDDVVVLEARGAMGYGPPDWNLVKQMVAEVELHLQAGKRLFVVDAREGRFVYGSSFADFVQPLLALMTGGRARVAFVAKDKSRWRAVFKEADFELSETIPDAVSLLRSGMPTAFERRFGAEGKPRPITRPD